MGARSAQGLPALHYIASFLISSRVNLFLFLVFGAICQLLASFRLGALLLLRFPRLFSFGVFSRDGPSEAQMRGTSFTMSHYGFALDPQTKQVLEAPVVRCASGTEAFLLKNHLHI
jgi:hypothetical protein